MLARAVAFHQAGDLAQANRLYKRILNAAPDHADAQHLRGLIEFQHGHTGRAIRLIEKAVRQNPGDARFHANLGRVLQVGGRSEEAIKSYQRSLALDAQSAEAHSDLAAALICLDRYEPALEACQAALTLNPELADAHLNMGIALRNLADFDRAIVCLNRALELRPNHVFSLFQKGRVLQEKGEVPAAETCYRQVIAKDPGIAEARSNLGNILKDRGDFSAAEAEYRAAIFKAPEMAEVHSNLGVALQEQGDPEGALACFDRAVELKPDDAETRRNRAMVLLLLGRFAEGWAEYEWRWKTKHFDPLRRDWDIPRWHGDDLAGKTILVHAEQGYGDTLQFIRYLTSLAARSRNIVFECPPPLVSLAKSVHQPMTVVAGGDPLPAADCHVPLMSLPGIFGTGLSSVPADIPYLDPGPDRVAEWRSRIADSARLRVGIVWRGSGRYKRDAVRSPGLEALRPLLESADCAFYSLQKDRGRDDLAAAGLAETVLDVAQEFSDFADTAAALRCLDLVISPDTAVAHLAGALGRPVWVLLPHVAEWRWLRNRDDSPWYPSARLFRQGRPGDWSGVITRVSHALAGEMAPKGTGQG